MKSASIFQYFEATVKCRREGKGRLGVGWGGGNGGYVPSCRQATGKGQREREREARGSKTSTSWTFHVRGGGCGSGGGGGVFLPVRARVPLSAHTHTQHTQRRVKTMAVSDMQEMASVKIILPRAPVLDEHARD